MAPHALDDLPYTGNIMTADAFPAPLRAGVSGKTRAHQPEPIAIVGLGCRLPGGASSPARFWDLLLKGGSGQCRVPSSRFSVDGFYSSEDDLTGRINMDGGYFLQEDIRAFENNFFGINNAEATYMDPQQRKLLEVVFECFESAGITLEDISGSNTGCYVGNFTVDFPTMQSKDVDGLHRYSLAGVGTTALSNRISHTFNLTGPSLVIDTACSSSLYTLHTACTALQSGDCDGAIVAAANLIQSIEQHITVMKAGVLSKTSTCHSFDASADGYGRADGVGALYLKRLSDAVKNNDPIRAVIKATAINANGRTPGITMPSSQLQEAVIRKAYQKAGLDVSSTAYVECHGTGTAVGDPIEVRALSRVFKSFHSKPVLIGSVKTNVGHSEAASAISSIIKAIMSMEKGYIPQTIGIQNINPNIKCDELGVQVVTEGQAWPNTKPWSPYHKVRRVGVNSFGYGGANGHAILESAAAHLPPNYGQGAIQALSQRGRYLLPLSGSTEEGLRARLHDLSNFDLSAVSIQNLAYTLSCRRSHLEKRGFVVASWNFIHADLAAEKLRSGPKGIGKPPSRFAFVFTGQGAQWPQVCKELLEEFSAFRDAFDEMDAVLQSLPHPPTWHLKDVLLEPKETSRVMQAAISQPICTAVQVGLIMLLNSFGLTPDAVIGHSSGEIAAAFCAGYISLAEAISTAYYRGFIVQRNERDGAMAATGISASEAHVLISALSLGDRARVACVNSPENVTLSGDADAIDILLEQLGSQRKFARKLHTQGQAYHSQHMLALGHEYQTLLEHCRDRLPSSSTSLTASATWISSVTGRAIRKEEVGPKYWRHNLENQVNFAQAVISLSKNGKYQLIELGPHSALKLPIRQTLANQGLSEEDMPYVASIVRDKNGTDCILEMMGWLFVSGHQLAFDKINGLDQAGEATYHVLHDLPPYRWTYAESPLWHEPRASSEFRLRPFPRHELLGSMVPAGNGMDRCWRNMLRLDDTAWLNDHKIGQSVVYPGAAYVTMAIEAILQAHGYKELSKPTVHMRNFNILSALVLPKHATDVVELFTTLRPMPISRRTTSNDWRDIAIVSFANGASTTHATGCVKVADSMGGTQEKYPVAPGSLESTAPRVWYERFSEKGLEFGPEFQTITDFAISGTRTSKVCRATATMKQSRHLQTNAIHPTTIDAMLQASIVATTAGVTGDLNGKVPTKIGSATFVLDLNASDVDCTINANADITGFASATTNAELVGADGCIKAKFEEVTFTTLESTSMREIAGDERHPMLRVLWKPDISPGFMTAENLSSYCQTLAAQDKDLGQAHSTSLASCVDLLGHKNPYLRILEMGSDANQLRATILDVLDAKTAFPRLLSYTAGHFDENNLLCGQDLDLPTAVLGEEEYVLSDIQFDLILISSPETSVLLVEHNYQVLKTVLADEGQLLAMLPLDYEFPGRMSGLQAIEASHNCDNKFVLGHFEGIGLKNIACSPDQFFIIETNHSSFGSTLEKELEAAFGQPIKKMLLSEVSEKTVPPSAIIVSLLELSEKLLTVTSAATLDQVKLLTNRASSLIWVTGGNLLQGSVPDLSVAFGLSRAVAMEQPSMRFIAYDVDDIGRDPMKTATNISSVLRRDPCNLADFEFIERDGVVHISRFVPDEAQNKRFRTAQGSSRLDMTLASAGALQLSIKTPGNLDSIFFKQIELPQLASGEVQVAAKAAGLNAKDFYALGGRVNTKNSTCLLEFCGIIKALGPDVTDLAIGDRVYVMAPSFFRTAEIVPSWACAKLTDDEDFASICSQTFVYATAIYGLLEKAKLQAGERVLIHSGAGGVGIAAIQVAQHCGAEVFATVSTKTKEDFLVEALSVKRENIFTSRDASFEARLMESTKGEGVDVVLSSVTGDLLHASWRCCSAFGRFVDIGKKELMDGGYLEMDVFLRNATYLAFDVSDLYNSNKHAHHEAWSQLQKRALQMVREKKTVAMPYNVFDVSELSSAFRSFASRNRIGKVVVSLEQDSSVLQVEPMRYATKLSRDKSYLMVGCLGGLGRSISKWMVERGAHNFVFLGRSGLDKAPARQLIEDLTRLGANCKVVRGDVCSEDDVAELIRQADQPIGGIIQAAMALENTLFSIMPIRYWHTCLGPKVHGTWNLHNALKGKEDNLDFFLLTSSISGSIGTATDSNYCAANYFLDNFARYRRSLGLKAISIGLGMISEVGYVHEHPDIESVFLRRGIMPINESEMLSMIDISLSQPMKMPRAYDLGAAAHILTGLEPFRMLKMRKQGFKGENPMLKSSRTAVITRALHSVEGSSSVTNDGDMPEEVSTAIHAGSSLDAAIKKHVAQRFGDMILVPGDQVDTSKPLDSYGMDSMIAAEFRAWFFQTFKVDIPFLELLNATATVENLSMIVKNEIEKRS